MRTKKRSKPRKRTFKPKVKEPGKAGWKKSCKAWEWQEKELPKRITIENSCWRFE
jgi:hypothetical protein